MAIHDFGIDWIILLVLPDGTGCFWHDQWPRERAVSNATQAALTRGLQPVTESGWLDMLLIEGMGVRLLLWSSLGSGTARNSGGTGQRVLCREGIAPTRNRCRINKMIRGFPRVGTLDISCPLRLARLLTIQCAVAAIPPIPWHHRRNQARACACPQRISSCASRRSDLRTPDTGE